MIRPFSFLAGCALAIFTSQAAAANLDPATRKAAIEATAKALRETYVFPAVGARAAAKITAALQAGDYDRLSDPAQFAERVSADMREVAHDGHLRIWAEGAPPPPELANSGPPPRTEAGFVRADRLAGGIGYVEVAGFAPAAIFRPTADKIMTSLAGSRAVVIDLRRNHGGDPEAVRYLVSFFVPRGKKLHINDLIFRKPGTNDFRRQDFWSEPTPVQLAGRPVYLLTSHETFSGGEEFSNDMKTETAAVLVGETTGGGANPGDMVLLGPDLTVFMPSGRPENPVTHTGWEGVGVSPTLATSRDAALKAALARLGQSGLTGASRRSRASSCSPRAPPPSQART